MSKKPQPAAKAEPPPATTTDVVVPPPDFAAEAGVGFEHATADDYAIPFLQILQALSPQVKRSEGAYIEGAAEGMLLNTVTRGVIDTEKTALTLIPCAYKHSFVEWRLREKGGGFVAEYDVAPQVKLTRDDKGRDIMPNGNQLNDTRTFYVLVIEDEGVFVPAVISMTSTQIKKAKQWLMQQNLLKLNGPSGPYTPPMFASRWVVTTVPESNEKGSWYGWKFEHGGYLSGPTDPLFVAARDFHKAVASGKVQADMSRSDADAAKGDQRIDPDTGEPLPPDAEF